MSAAIRELRSRFYIETSFAVTGAGSFPVDMLRRDQCFPMGTEDVDSITLLADDDPEAYFAPRTVHLGHVGSPRWTPTADRWNSFGWTVVEKSITQRRLHP